MYRGEVSNPLRAYQPFDFSGCIFDRKITPTNLDFSVDLGSGAFIIGEFKLGDAPMPKGQRMHLERLGHSLSSPPSECVVFVASHNTPEGSPIDAASAKVTEYYWRDTWIEPAQTTNVATLCQWFGGRHSTSLALEKQEYESGGHADHSE